MRREVGCGGRWEVRVFEVEVGVRGGCWPGGRRLAMSWQPAGSEFCSCISNLVKVSIASIGAEEACAAAKRWGKRRREHAASEPA